MANQAETSGTRASTRNGQLGQRVDQGQSAEANDGVGRECTRWKRGRDWERATRGGVSHGGRKESTRAWRGRAV